MIPVGDLQLHLGVGDSDAELLAQLELAAVAFMERETSRFFGDAAAYTEVIIGNGTPRLWLAERPDDDVLATVLERRYAGGTETTITATDAPGTLYFSSKGGTIPASSDSRPIPPPPACTCCAVSLLRLRARR